MMNETMTESKNTDFFCEGDFMAEEALKVVTMRNDFYRDGQRKLVTGFLLSLFLNLVLGIAFSYIITHPPAPKYFSTSINGRITPLIPLDMPNQSDSAVLQWANQAAIAAFSYNFVNWRQELQAASGFFAPSGWDQFNDALKASNNLQAVLAKHLVVSAVATSAPVILQKGVLNGVFSWRVQMPILVTYQSASESSQQNNIVTMLITRVDTLNYPRGIGIAQFVVGPASGGIS